MLVAEGQVEPTGRKLAMAAGLAVPTAHHLLSTLVIDGMLTRDSHARYGLGAGVARLADLYQREIYAPEYLLRPLQQLAMSTGETGYLAAWRHGDIRLLAVVEGTLPVRVSIPMGPYLDAHARATGKLLLALGRDNLRGEYLRNHPLRALTPRTITDTDEFVRTLNQVRKRGFALDEQEYQLGVSCIAAPIMNGDVVLASYSLSVPSERFRKRREELLSALIAVASTLSTFSPSTKTQTVAGPSSTKRSILHSPTVSPDRVLRTTKSTLERLQVGDSVL